MVLTKLAEMGADRKSVVVALGGGVVGGFSWFCRLHLYERNQIYSGSDDPFSSG